MTAQPEQVPARHTFIIAKAGDAHRVYSPDQPHQLFFVSGEPDHPVCTCAESRTRTADPTFRCSHVTAVFGNGSGAAAPSGAPAAAPRFSPSEPESSSDSAHMVIKRSVSPDGRIDALSVELACSVDGLTSEEIHTRASQIIQLQNAIAAEFQDRTDEPRAVHQPASDEPSSAHLVSVGGMDGKWGRRLFLVVQVKDKLLKFFGSEKQLVDAIASAGFQVQHLAEGIVLNLPCRVITKPSPDGRFQNIETIMPATTITR